MLIVNDKIRIPLRDIDFEFTRSSGPGGQNVNKVSSKAVMRWRVEASVGLPAEVRERFILRWRGRINSDGELLIAGDRYRAQRRNIEDCLLRLKAMIAEVAVPPKARHKTKPGRGARERRLAHKRALARKKGRRGSVAADFDG